MPYLFPLPSKNALQFRLAWVRAPPQKCWQSSIPLPMQAPWLLAHSTSKCFPSPCASANINILTSLTPTTSKDGWMVRFTAFQKRKWRLCL